MDVAEVEDVETKEIGHDPRVPKDVSPTRQDAKAKLKRGRGRPKTKKDFVSKLPAPIRYDFGKHQVGEFFAYLRSVPRELLTETELIWYRLHPIVDMTEGGTKKKELESMPAADHPFNDEDWERQLLHRFGCGEYRCFMNENGYTVARCMTIETVWDPDTFPPTLVDPKWLDPNHRQNLTYIDWLRRKGIKLPNEADKEAEEMEMQVAETISKLTDTVIAQANRINTPVPQIPQQPSMTEKLTFEMASGAIDMFKEKTKSEIQAGSQQSNGLELVDKIVSVAEKMNPKNGGDSTTTLILKNAMDQAEEARKEAAETRREMFQMMRDSNKATAAPVKSFLDQVREIAEMKNLMKEAFGVGDGGGEAEATTPGKETIPEMLIKALPQLAQTGLGLWGQFNQSMAYASRMKEMETLAKTGQLPPGAAPIVMPQVQQAQPAQQQQTVQNQQQQAPTEPTPTASPEALAEYEKYKQYHWIVGALQESIISHLNDESKDGCDFANWLVDGYGRTQYITIKNMGEEALMGAIKTYSSLWQRISGMEPEVRKFIHEFVTRDEIVAAEANDQGDDNDEEGDE